jgi:hypothetical protein
MKTAYGGGAGRPEGMHTEEVDDEAAVGAAAGGLAEEGHPVRRAGGGERLGRAVDDDVARVGERVAEAEDGPVRLLAPPRRGESRRRREEQQRGGDEERRSAALGTRGEGGHCWWVSAVRERRGSLLPCSLAWLYTVHAATVGAGVN